MTQETCTDGYDKYAQEEETMTAKPEVLILADDRPTSVCDDLYQWSIDAEGALRRLHAENEDLRDTVQFVERWAVHHGTKGCMSATETLSAIQHYPGITEVTDGYADGKRPATFNPYARIQELELEVAASVLNTPVPKGYVLVSEQALPALGVLDSLKAAAVYPLSAPQLAPWDGTINPADFTVSTFTHGVNSSWLPKPQNGVCITHKPTGCFESETSLKSSHGNKALAWDRLIKRLEALAIAHPAEGVPAQAVPLSESRNQRVYVAGPMTGMPDYNFPAFNAAASMLRAKGWHVENPAEHGIVAGATWADYMHYDLARIATCSTIYLLPGWCLSRGAALEAHIASCLGMTFQYADGAERYHLPSAIHPTQQGVDATKFMNVGDYESLERFAETAGDGQDYDIGKTAIARLAGFGCLQSHGFGKYSVTAFGDYILKDWDGACNLPFSTQAERHALDAAKAKQSRESNHD